MEIRSYLGANFINYLLHLGGVQEVASLSMDIALRAIHAGFDPAPEPLVPSIATSGLPADLKRVLCDQEFTVTTAQLPEYLVFYCEHQALVGMPPGLEGLREVSKKGDQFVTDLLKRMELWRKYHRIDEYISMNINGLTDDTAGFVIIGKLELTKDVL